MTNFWQVSAGIAKMKTEQLDSYSNSTTQNTGVRWSPEWSATLWSSYTLGALTLGGGARYLSEQKRVIAAGAAASPLPNIPSYWVADLMAAYRVNRNLNLRLNVYNLFDQEYISTLNNGGTRMSLGQPRSAMLSAEMQF